jgi:hypothetical protein
MIRDVLTKGVFLVAGFGVTLVALVFLAALLISDPLGIAGPRRRHGPGLPTAVA